jgi:hypothetical protein
LRFHCRSRRLEPHHPFTSADAQAHPLRDQHLCALDIGRLRSQRGPDFVSGRFDLRLKAGVRHVMHHYRHPWFA